MNTSYPVRSGTDCSYGFSPAAMRRAMVVTLASSIACPCSTRCSPARTAASKPDAALALAMTVLLQCLFDRFGSVFPQCGLMVFPGVVIVSR